SHLCSHPGRPAGRRRACGPLGVRLGHRAGRGSGVRREWTMSVTIAIVGATGMVGSVMRELVAERFADATVRLFASARSAGSVIEHAGSGITVEDVDGADYSGIDIAIFSAGGA